MTKNKITVSVVGASGFGGGELLRLLLFHPNVEVKQVTSQRYAKFPISVVHPNLRNRTNLRFCNIQDLESCDLLILALPNGKSQLEIDNFFNLGSKVIDLGADFRIKNVDTYQKWYGTHLRPELLDRFVYGISELHREDIKGAHYVSCGGCEATCSILTLYPLFKSNLVEIDKTVVDAKLGSSASGNKPKESTHHPIRSGCLRSYKPTMHRHTAEIEQELGIFLPSEQRPNFKIHVSATAVENIRGILVTAHTFLKNDISEREVWDIYKRAYKDEPFIRLINEKIGNYRFPEPKILAGTNYCDIGMQKDKRSNRLVVIGAIDNLMKGTAGQAVQAMNIMFGFEETTGLEFTGLHPI
jgi:LysW-gamma-L-alpha-aminoadipyl-6-phosphate/LysW-L-glutamyl-5-phosphate reductase